MRHVLLIRFKPECSASDIESLFAHFHRLSNEIAGLCAVECGVNESPEGLDKGYTHAVLMTFDDAAARDAYLPHPAHEALKTVFVPMIDDIIVFDYVAA